MKFVMSIRKASPVVLCMLLEFACGNHQGRSLIVGGRNADHYPYFCTLQEFCGGALIAPDILLTAGHCKSGDMHRVHPHVGAYSYQEYEEVFRIDEAIRHPLWNRSDHSEDMVFDFTVIKLDGPSSMPFLKINRDNAFPNVNQDVVVLGLGFLADDTNERPEVLQQVTLQTISNEECDAAANDEISFADLIHETHLCTHTPDKDACDYDSGGPIVARDSHGNELLVGLVSWGIGCADPQLPGVNARVSAVSDWIDEMVCLHSDDPPADFRCFPNDEHHLSQRLSLVLGSVLFFSLALLYLKCCRRKQFHVYFDLGDAEDADGDETGKGFLKITKTNSEYTALSSSCEGSPQSTTYKSIDVNA